MNQFKHAKWWRSYLDKLWQSFWKLKFMKNQALELHSPLPKSFKVCKERSKEKQRGKASKVKRSKEDSSCSLLSHFWSTSRSPFSTCYIPFQSSGSQKSNASNRVRFGAAMRKIWPSEDNCSGLVRNFRTTPCVVRVLCEICTTPSKFAQPMHGENFPLFLPTPL